MKILACPVCKKLGVGRALCTYCAQALWERREPVTRKHHGFVARSLFSWRKDEWPGLRWWVNSLKQKTTSEFWREPAVWCLDVFPRPRVAPVLVPVPSEGDNHALGFALEFSRWSGWRVEQPLRVLSSGPQKLLGRVQRQARRFIMDPACNGFTNVIVIDDVITTGSTAQAAFKALGAPKGLEVWCLVDRRPCGLPEPLL